MFACTLPNPTHTHEITDMRICNYSGIELGRFQANHGKTKGCLSGAVIQYRVKAKRHQAGAVRIIDGKEAHEVAIQVSQKLAAKTFKLV